MNCCSPQNSVKIVSKFIRGKYGQNNILLRSLKLAMKISRNRKLLYYSKIFEMIKINYLTFI